MHRNYNVATSTYRKCLQNNLNEGAEVAMTACSSLLLGSH